MGEKQEEALTLASLRGASLRRTSRRRIGPESEKLSQASEVSVSLPQMGLFPQHPEDGPTPSLVASPHLIPPRYLPPSADTLARNTRLDEIRGAFAPPVVPAPSHQIAETKIQGSPAAAAVEPRSAPARAAVEKRVWTVRAIVADVRRQVEGEFGEIWVEGEICACRAAASGHLYLTLKDGEAQLPTVLFRRQAQLLRFRPTAGMTVLVRGRLSVYESRGELQLVGEVLEPRGAGALLVAFEQVKARLAAEGLFAVDRKQPLPPFPRWIGVVTSTSGAVLHDIVTVVRRRHSRLNLLVYPAVVQGPGCAAAMAAGVRWFNANVPSVDLILLARGGGSPEDLAGFNDEALARVIVASTLPVVSAVGHETDFTIADFVADLRAPTPSAAAEIITQSQFRIEETLDALARRLLRASRYRLLEARQRFTRMAAEAALRRTQLGVDRRQQRVDDLERRMLRAMEHQSASRLRRLEALSRRLERANVTTRLAANTSRLDALEQRLTASRLRCVSQRRGLLNQAGGRLQALSPLAVLSRGYALLYNLQGTEGSIEDTGRLITSSSEIALGTPVRARLARGSLLATVTGTDRS